MDFKKMDQDAIENFQSLITQNNYESSFYTNGVILAWRDYFQVEYASIDHDTMLLRGRNDERKLVYFFPVGAQITKALQLIPADAEIDYIPTNYKHLFFDAREMPNEFDYVYEKTRYQSLSGKEKAAMRNHINSFKKHYPDYSYRALSRQNLADALSLLERLQFDDDFKNIEKAVNQSILPHLERYHLFGYGLYVHDMLVAFTIAEHLHETVFIHFEKNSHDYVGSGDMNRHCFATTIADLPFRYINREEDVGDPGLRTSKMRLCPDILQPKYKHLPH